MSSPLTRQIANSIAEACVALHVPIRSLTATDYCQWLKANKGLGEEDLKLVKQHMSRLGGFVKIRDAFYVASPTEQLVESVELANLAKLSRQTVTSLANDEMFLSRLDGLLRNVWRDVGSLPKSSYIGKKQRAKTKRALVIALSDLHFGSSLDPRELPYKFDFEEEASALAYVVKSACDFKLDHRDETEAVVWLGGDIIAGKIHDRQAGRPVAEQFADAVHLLVHAVWVLAGSFKKVTIYCSTGNHDRDESRHADRAFDGKWDSRATQIYYAVKMSTKHLSNVSFNIPRTPHVEWELFGHRFYATHGDTGLAVGNPSRSINIGGIENQMRAIQTAEAQAGRKPFSVFLSGHVHQGLHLPLPTGDLVINPALIPNDSYARGVGFVQSRPGQVMFEVTAEHAVGDLRFHHVTEQVLADKSLHQLIVPFKDF